MKEEEPVETDDQMTATTKIWCSKHQFLMDNNWLTHAGLEKGLNYRTLFTIYNKTNLSLTWSKNITLNSSVLGHIVQKDYTPTVKIPHR